MGTSVYTEDPNAISDASWHEWTINLSDFTQGDVTQVKAMTLGIGNANGPAGGFGTVYVDEIRLNP